MAELIKNCMGGDEEVWGGRCLNVSVLALLCDQKDWVDVGMPRFWEIPGADYGEVSKSNQQPNARKKNLDTESVLHKTWLQGAVSGRQD